MYTKPFGQMSSREVGIAGGKGASLGEMMQAGIPVPPGFVVLAGAFERFLEETDLSVEVDAILHTVNHKEMHTVENASEKIQALILAAQMPKDIATEIKKEFRKLGAEYVAARSSATAEDSASAAWAGQLDSFLNTTEKDLLDNVKKCWASLFTPRAIFYRFELHDKNRAHGTDTERSQRGTHTELEKVSVAVVVQKMVESEVSGIAFSVHPVTEDHNQIIIEAGFGLGEAIVSGQITPDSYVVEKNPRRIIDKNISEQEKQLVRSSSIPPYQRGAARLRAGDVQIPRLADSPLPLGKGELRTPNEWKAVSKEKGGKQKLSDEQILELSELILKIENHYGFPCDIEWALAEGKFYILQSRPITTLSLKITETEGKGEHVRDYKDIDWAQYLSRPKEFFLINILVKDFKGAALKKVLGFGHDYWLFLYNGGKTIDLYRRVDELQESDAFMRTVIINREKIKRLFADGRRVIRKTENIIKSHKSGKRESKGLPERYKTAIQQVVEYFVHAVEIPFMIGGILETDNLTSDSRFKWVLKECEFFRGLSHYPDFYERVLAPLTGEVAKVMGATKEEMMFITADEILGFLDGKEDAKDLLKKTTTRSKGFVGFAAFGKEEFIDDPEFLKSFYPEVPQNTTEIKGNVGYMGKVKGRVTVVVTKADFEKFKDEDILVTIQSNPSFMPVIARASAIVADEGGIMSHAAIVSRELRKPCIIGTKIATKVLKDGDMVEVDADKGVVKIIKRTENK